MHHSVNSSMWPEPESQPPKKLGDTSTSLSHIDASFEDYANSFLYKILAYQVNRKLNRRLFMNPFSPLAPARSIDI